MLRSNLLIHVVLIGLLRTTAVPARDFFAEALDMVIGEPELLMVRRAYDVANHLIDILYCHHNPRRFHFRLELDAETYRQA